MKVQEDGVFGSETINAMNKLSQDEIVKVNKLQQSGDNKKLSAVWY